jgi:peptidoglycan/LPS O-acetylase OafA/YrhL
MPQVSGHSPALDGLRVIAALAVLTTHVGSTTGFDLTGSPASWVISHGTVGVPIFFVLSGLLLYRPWARAALSGGVTPSTRTYLRRRAARILPVYWLVVVVAMVAFNGRHLGSLTTWAQYTFLAQIYDPHPWWGGTGITGLAQMWSLAVEVSFYLALPLIAAALAWWAARGAGGVGDRARRLLTGVALLGLSSYPFSALIFYPHLELWLGDTLPRDLSWFAGGMALTVVAEWAHLEHRDHAGAEPGSGKVAAFCRTVAGSAGACWLIAIAAFALICTPLAGPESFFVPSLWNTEVLVALETVIAVALVAPVAFQPARPTWVTRSLGGRVMGFLGRISYGIFLWQFIVIDAFFNLTHAPVAFAGANYSWPSVVAILAITAALTVAISAIGYYAVEVPAQLLGRPSRSRHSQRPIPSSALDRAGVQ